MTEISQRGKLFYGYYNFNIYFFIIFGTNVVPKFEVSKLAVISHSGTLVHAYHGKLEENSQDAKMCL